MKYIILFVFIAVIIAGCSKSGSSVHPVPPSLSFSGKYKTFKIIDTSYNLNATTIASIEIQTVTGDTSYNNPGTKFYNVEPNPGGPYNGQYAMADTLIFASATAGTESDAGNRFPFTYSLKTNAFNDDLGDTNNPGFSSTVIQLDATTIEVIAVQKPGSLVDYISAFYYKKL